MSDLEALRVMLVKAGIEFLEFAEVGVLKPQHVEAQLPNIRAALSPLPPQAELEYDHSIRVYGGYAGFFSEFAFKDGALVSVTAWE